MPEKQGKKKTSTQLDTKVRDISDLQVLKEVLHDRFMERFSGIVAGFTPKRFDGDLLLFTSMDRAYRTSSWEPFLSGRIHRFDLKCDHQSMSDPGPIDEIGRLLNEHLAELRRADAPFEQLPPSSDDKQVRDATL